MAAVRPSIAQAAVQSWRDTAAVLRALTAQAWIAFAISAVLAYLQRLIGTGEKAFGTGLLLAGFIIACAQAFLLTPYLIAIHRFIILGEKAAGYELTPAAHRFQLFFLWSIALSMFYWVPAFLLGGLLHEGDRADSSGHSGLSGGVGDRADRLGSPHHPVSRHRSGRAGRHVDQRDGRYQGQRMAHHSHQHVVRIACLRGIDRRSAAGAGDRALAVRDRRRRNERAVDNPRDRGRVAALRAAREPGESAGLVEMK
jgi:hypothetical protein